MFNEVALEAWLTL